MTEARRPTPAQLDALQEYALAHGRYWKAKLRLDWEFARTRGELQQLRNQFGPLWLLRFRFPREVSRKT
jgi:hypothetical protein